jgi:hypothetical protein
MQRTLASLALHPEVTVILLVESHLLLPLNIDLLRLWNAGSAQHIILVLEDVLAAKTSLTHHCKLTQTSSLRHLRNIYASAVFSCEESSFRVVGEDRFEYSY